MYYIKSTEYNFLMYIEYMDIKKLHDALGNEKNEDIINTTFQNIEKDKNNIITQLPISEEEQLDLYVKLENYRYCANVENIKVGRDLVWIPLQDVDKIKTRAGRSAKIYDTYDDTNIIYIIRGMLYTITFSKNLIFQKITDEEKHILQMVEHLQTIY